MPEENTATTTNTNAAGSEPTTTVTANTNANAFDPTKVSDEEFAKVFDDPRLFKHDRFKTLAEAKKERDQLKTQQDEAEKKKLEEQKQFEELAKKNQDEATTWKDRYISSLTDNAIVLAAATKGAVDLEAVKKLIDRKGISIDSENHATGVDEALDALQKDKPYLFNASNAQNRVGNGTNPANGNQNTQTFTRSQLQNAKFYRENEAAIKQAMKAGTIVNDLKR